MAASRVCLTGRKTDKLATPFSLSRSSNFTTAAICTYCSSTLSTTRSILSRSGALIKERRMFNAAVSPVLDVVVPPYHRDTSSGSCRACTGLKAFSSFKNKVVTAFPPLFALQLRFSTVFLFLPFPFLVCVHKKIRVTQTRLVLSQLVQKNGHFPGVPLRAVSATGSPTFLPAATMDDDGEDARRRFVAPAVASLSSHRPAPAPLPSVPR